ncbi:MAG: hypothetical protein ACRERE_27765, partial [Candidatus Entotheonellia bacterium]
MRGLTATGVLCLVVSAWLIWVNAPISGGANPSLTCGWLAGVIGGVAGMAWLCRSSRVLAICGVVGLGLVSFSVLYMALMDPALWFLAHENAQFAAIITFSSHYFPGNFGIAPAFQTNLSTETLIDQVAAAFYFMSWGWWICLFGSVLTLIGAHHMWQKASLRWVLIACAVVLASQGSVLFTGLVAHYQREKAERHMVVGRYAQAIQHYERAQRGNPQLAASERAHLCLGEAYYHLGR